jgi:hypothetical protein
VLVAPGAAGTGRAMDRATVMVTDRATVMVTVTVMGQANLPSFPTSSVRRGLGSSPLKLFFSFKTSKLNFIYSKAVEIVAIMRGRFESRCRLVNKYNEYTYIVCKGGGGMGFWASDR